MHLVYLHYNCPIDLAVDESYYWDWSRQLDWCYYSKPPGVAALIRASCAIFGDTMPAVRYPALLLAMGTTLVTFALALRIFRDRWTALGAAAALMTLPLFIAGSVLMTIDAPLVFMWGLATLLLLSAIFDERKWAWIAAAITIGLGFLFKQVAFVWFIGIFVFLAIDRDGRKWLRTPWPYAMLLLASVFTLPVFIWNAQHAWVTAKHVGADTVASDDSGFRPYGVLEFIVGMIGVLGPAAAIAMPAAILWSWRLWQRKEQQYRQCMLLLLIALPILIGVLAISMIRKAQLNWPATSFLMLTVIMAGFLAERLRDPLTRKRWRPTIIGLAITAILVVPIAHFSGMLYPLIASINAHFGTHLTSGIDPARRMRHWREVAQRVQDVRKQLPGDALVLAADRPSTSEMAFYLPGHPVTYCYTTYLKEHAGRFSQYDIWENRALDQPQLFGRDAVLIGPVPPEIAQAFDSVEHLPLQWTDIGGVRVRPIDLSIGRNFKGLHRRIDGIKHY